MYSIHYLTAVLLLGGLQSAAGRSLMQEQLDIEEHNCTQQMDVIAVVDASDSINEDDFAKLKDALVGLTYRLGLDSQQRFGVVVYSSGLGDIIPLSNDRELLEKQIYGITHLQDGTATHLGIEKMRIMMEEDNLPGKPVPKVGIVITDGKSKKPNQTLEEADKAKEAGVSMFAVGVGHDEDIDEDELRQIASTNDQVLMIDNFDELLNSISSLVKKVCVVNGGWSDWVVERGACPVTCGSGERHVTRTRSCTNPPPSNGGKPCPGRDEVKTVVNCTKAACPVDGEWSEWSRVTRGECSATCGGGNRTCTQTRSCTNPAPKHGGQRCQGNYSRTFTEECGKEKCPEPRNICADCIFENGIGFLPVTDDCSRYIQCISESSYVIMSCGTGLYWSQDILTCVVPAKSTCPVAPTTETPTTTASTGPVACDDRKRQVLDDVTKYEENIPGYGWMTRPCPTGTIFDNTQCRCVTRKEDTQTTTASSSTVSSVCSRCSPSTAGVCYVTLSCTSYIQCVNFGVTHYVKVCPQGLNWNPEDKVCVWPNQWPCTDGATTTTTSSAPPPTTTTRSSTEPELSCKPELYLPLSDDAEDHSGNQLTVQNEGVSIEDHHAIFLSGSILRVNRFSNVDFGTTLVISFFFRPIAPWVSGQAIVSNADCEMDGTFYIIRLESSILFRVVDEAGYSHELEVPCSVENIDHYMSVSLSIAEGTMTARVGVEVAYTEFFGRIGRSKCALQVGRASGYAPYQGAIADFKLYMCNKEDSRAK